MIYIVSGDGPRCGSSMMMLGIAHGGIPAAYSEVSEKLASDNATEDYHPNPTGRFELPFRTNWQLGFPKPDIFDNTVVKIFPPPWGGLLRMVPGKYRICWMHRPAKARWDSFLKAHEQDEIDFTTWPENIMDFFMHYRDARAQETFELLKIRSDILSITELDFDEVLKKPLEAFWTLKHEGWPIDPESAAKVVDPSLKHF